MMQATQVESRIYGLISDFCGCNLPADVYDDTYNKIYNALIQASAHAVESEQNSVNLSSLANTLGGLY